MAIYQWKGIQGSQLNSGEIEAANTQEATTTLQGQNIIVTNIVLISGTEEGANTNQGKVKERKAKKVKNKELMVFTKKLATMVQAGLPILKTLKMLESQAENPNFRWVINRIYTNVESGSTLSDAFSRHPIVFDTIYINILRAGETSGKLTTFLYKLVTQLEKTEKIRSKVKGALMYPIILVIVAVTVILIMLIKVVPVFQKMFASVGSGLPGPTQLIISMSEFLKNPAQGGVMLIIIVLTVISIKVILKRSPAARYKFDALLLKIPLIGEVIQKSILAKIAMIEGNLSAAGVPVLESLDIISRTVKNMVYRDAFKAIQNGVSAGEPISSLYGANPIFPPTFSQMLAVGEETGNMDEMFEATALYYEEEFDMVVDRLTELLEPIMIVFMGITVGFIIVAMYMPIFQIGQTIK